MFRSRAPTYIDKQHFSNTAVNTRAVNLRQTIFRGGLRF